MSPSTHQDSPKVPEHPAGQLGEALSDVLWPWAATKAGACPNFAEAPDECGCITCKALVALREAEDAGSTIPVSALLSDEAKRAFYNALPAEVIEAEITLDEIAVALQAAIQHVGGAK